MPPLLCVPPLLCRRCVPPLLCRDIFDFSREFLWISAGFWEEVLGCAVGGPGHSQGAVDRRVLPRAVTPSAAPLVYVGHIPDSSQNLQRPRNTQKHNSEIQQIQN
jgi:hypothetical protein